MENKRIPKNVMYRLERLSKLYDIQMSSLLKDLESLYNELKKDYPTKKNSSLYTIAARRIAGSLNAELGSMLSRATVFTGFFFGSSALKDVTKAKKRKILRMDEAKMQQYHPDEDTWIDPKTGRPITGPVYVRTFHGFGSSGRNLDLEKVKYMKLEAWRDLATSLEYTPYKLYYFRALDKSDDSMEYYYLGASRATIFRESPTQLSFDEIERAVRSSGQTIYSADDIDYLYEINKGSNELFFVEAEVGRIMLREEKSSLIELVSIDRGPVIIGSIPQYLKIDFTQGQQVIFLCRFGDVKLRTGDTAPRAFIEGFISLPLDRPFDME